MTQLTDGELSLKSAMCLWQRSFAVPSMHSQRRRYPAISRSEFVILPLGLSKDTTSFRISSGHCKRNTVGGISESSPMTTPPTPWLEASTMPIESGQSATRPLHCGVGRALEACRIVLISEMASNNVPSLCMYTTFGRR